MGVEKMKSGEIGVSISVRISGEPRARCVALKSRRNGNAHVVRGKVGAANTDTRVVIAKPGAHVSAIWGG